MADITPAANIQSILQAANYAAVRALLDLEAGTDFNAYNALLASFAANAYSGSCLTVSSTGNDSTPNPHYLTIQAALTAANSGSIPAVRVLPKTSDWNEKITTTYPAVHLHFEAGAGYNFTGSGAAFAMPGSSGEVVITSDSYIRRTVTAGAGTPHCLFNYTTFGKNIRIRAVLGLSITVNTEQSNTANYALFLCDHSKFNIDAQKVSAHNCGVGYLRCGRGNIRALDPIEVTADDTDTSALVAFDMPGDDFEGVTTGDNISKWHILPCSRIVTPPKSRVFDARGKHLTTILYVQTQGAFGRQQFKSFSSAGGSSVFIAFLDEQLCTGGYDVQIEDSGAPLFAADGGGGVAGGGGNIQFHGNILALKTTNNYALSLIDLEPASSCVFHVASEENDGDDAHPAVYLECTNAAIAFSVDIRKIATLAGPVARCVGPVSMRGAEIRGSVIIGDDTEGSPQFDNIKSLENTNKSFIAEVDPAGAQEITAVTVNSIPADNAYLTIVIGTSHSFYASADGGASGAGVPATAVPVEYVSEDATPGTYVLALTDAINSISADSAVFDAEVVTVTNPLNGPATNASSSSGALTPVVTQQGAGSPTGYLTSSVVLLPNSSIKSDFHSSVTLADGVKTIITSLI